MKKILFLSILLFSMSTFAQIHNRTFKFNIGLSHEQFDLKKGYQSFNDTSLTNHFDHKFTLPAFSFSEDFTLNQLFSVSGTIGYQLFKTDYNNANYGTHLFFGSINPQLSLFYRAGFEIYIKLKIGMIYRISKYSELSDQTQRFFPENYNLFTGVTGGFNFFMNDNWGINLELSLWSPEFINFGLTYRFFKGEKPTLAEQEGYYVD